MRSRPAAMLLPVLLLVSLSENAFAAKNQSIQHVLNARYRGHVLTQRHFFAGQHLVYDIDGKLLNPGTIGSWTLDGLIEVQSVREGHDQLIIRCCRLYVGFVHGKKRLFKVGKDEIDIVGHGQPLTLENLSQAFTRIFLTPSENLSDFVPAYWRPFLASRSYAGSTNSSKLPLPSNVPNPAVTYEKNVTPPSPVYTPEAPYGVEARYLRFSGTVVLRFTVDKTGHVSHVTIVKPAGLGLDDQAVKTVRTWRFRPGQLNGKPISVPLTVNCSFNLSR